MSINGRKGNKEVLSKTIVGGTIGVIILMITFGFVYYLIQGSYAKPTYSFSNSNLVISGQFGVTIDLSGATVIQEHSQVPTTETKTNGAAIGNIEKGYFKIVGTKVYRNVMDKSISNYILITDKNGSKYYINCASSEETDNLYIEITKNM